MRTVSIKEIVARVITNIGRSNLSPEYYNDILTWISQGVNQLETKFNLITKSTILNIEEHIAYLPCDFQELIAVEYNGRRLPLGSDITDLPNQSSIYHNNNLFESHVFQPTQLPQNQPYNSDKLENIDNNRYLHEYYKLQLNVIQTSFETGKIKLHYLALPLDNEGFPLIPNDEDFKNALYWYVLMMLIGSGFKHKVFDYNYCFQQFEQIHAPRAISSMKRWSPEKAKRLYRSINEIIQPTDSYARFFINEEKDNDERY